MLNFGRIEGLPDATEFVIYGAATLKTGALTQTGEKVSVGCMAKIEMNVQENAMRITLRSVHPAASQAILQTVKNLLL
jgi:site-specific DNA-cytosine methylase